MTSDVRSVLPDDTLEHAAPLMWDGDFGVVPVADEAQRVVAGMLTDRDVCVAVYLQGSHCDIEYAIRLHRVQRLPVVDAADRLVGIVALHDLARHYRGGRYRDATNPDDLSRTLSAICESREHLRHVASDRVALDLSGRVSTCPPRWR